MRTLVLFALAASLLVGCGRVSVQTQLNADGAFTRTITYAMPQNKEASSMAFENRSLRDTFSIPSTGPGVSVEEKNGNNENSIRVTRSLASASEPLQDITVLDESKAPLLTSTVSVKKRPDGLIEYSEELHWVGKMKQEPIDEEFRAIVKRSLPEKYRVTATIDKATDHCIHEGIRVLLGPSEPMLTNAMLNPDLFKIRFREMILQRFPSVLQQEIPGMTTEEAENTVRNMIPGLEDSSMLKKSSHPAPPQPGESADDNSDLIPLTYSVSFPGKIVQTDGIRNDVDGSVYWSLYAPVVEYGDVKLDAVVDPTK